MLYDAVIPFPVIGAKDMNIWYQRHLKDHVYSSTCSQQPEYGIKRGVRHRING